MRAVSAKSNSEPDAAATAPADGADLALLQRWFDALKTAEASASAAFVFGEASSVIAALGVGGERDAAVIDTARGARERKKLQLAPLKASGQTVLAAPLDWPSRPGAVMAILLDRPLWEASRFAKSFQLSVDRLAGVLAQPRQAAIPAPRAPRPDEAPPPFGPADALALLKAPDAGAFAEALFTRLEASLQCDAACLVRIRGRQIRLLRSSSKFDPLPRGGRIGHARRVALLSAARSYRTMQLSWSAPGTEDRANLDLGLLATGEGPAGAVAVCLPELDGPGRVVFLAEYLDRDKLLPPEPQLEQALEELGGTIRALRGRGRKRDRAATAFPWGRWLLRGALALVVVAALVWLALPAPLVLTGEATLESTDLRSIVATRDGILSKVYFEPGQQVKKGDVIAEFDTRELRLRDNRIVAQLAQAEQRRQTAIGGFKAADIRVVDAEIDALTAEQDLVKLMLQQSVVTAEGDAIIIAGDMAERVGSALRKGEQMFQLAPLTGYTVTIDLPQQDVTSVKVGQTGALKLTAMPFDEFPVEIERVSPAANEASATGAFNIRATLPVDNPSFRPGMKGVVHVAGEQTIRAWGLSREFWFWLRMQAWRWIP